VLKIWKNNPNPPNRALPVRHGVMVHLHYGAKGNPAEKWCDRQKEMPHDHRLLP
jgi:hypothetical protein